MRRVEQIVMVPRVRARVRVRVHVRLCVRRRVLPVEEIVQLKLVIVPGLVVHLLRWMEMRRVMVQIEKIVRVQVVLLPNVVHFRVEVRMRGGMMRVEHARSVGVRRMVQGRVRLRGKRHVVPLVRLCVRMVTVRVRLVCCMG